jgi:hypothetical protein
MTNSPGQHDAVHLYIEALSATMAPKDFQLLGEMLQQTTANPPPQDPTVEHSIPPEVFREYATIIGIMLTGKIDHPVTQKPNGAWTVLTAADVADNPGLGRREPGLDDT